MHVWPQLSDAQWIEVEISLKDLIIGDYAKRNNVNPQSLTQSEVRDIILGAEIAPPSEQRQQMAELEKQTRETASAAQATATATRTVNKFGDEIVTVSTSAYENAAFKSKSDWRARAVAASNLHLRCAHLYVTDVDVGADDPAQLTYVLPKNALRRVITVADRRTQCGAYIFGLAPEGAQSVREVRAVVFAPQIASHKDGVQFPDRLPTPEKHPELEGLELLGVIHTLPAEQKHLPPQDALMAHALGESWPHGAVFITVAFTDGSATCSAYSVTQSGLQWADKARSAPTDQHKGFTTDCFKPAQLLLSDKFLAALMAPPLGIWNYNLQAVRFAKNMDYALQYAQPLEFFHALHRPAHFLAFASGDSDAGVDANENYFK
jgi:pre-mRNA-processing factor 8